MKPAKLNLIHISILKLRLMQKKTKFIVVDLRTSKHCYKMLSTKKDKDILPWKYLMKDLNIAEITGAFYEPFLTRPSHNGLNPNELR